METVRIAVASTPLTATLDEAVPAAVAAIETAARLGARLVCLPETGLPGHRCQRRSMPPTTPEAIDRALADVAHAARAAGIAAIVGVERHSQQGLAIASVVVGADGEIVGEQWKTQIDPAEEPHYVAGSGRRVFHAAGLVFGVAICHEAFRYPEIVRAFALAGAQIAFVPHYVTTEGGPVPGEFCATNSPYNEKALVCRALENTVYVAAANFAGDDQGAATCIICPDGELLARAAYGSVETVAADVDPGRATALLARRWAPERNIVTL